MFHAGCLFGVCSISRKNMPLTALIPQIMLSSLSMFQPQTIDHSISPSSLMCSKICTNAIALEPFSLPAPSPSLSRRQSSTCNPRFRRRQAPQQCLQLVPSRGRSLPILQPSFLSHHSSGLVTRGLRASLTINNPKPSKFCRSSSSTVT
jgi:hypothetical protein